MSLTFGEIRKAVAPYAGRAGLCPTADKVAAFARQVLQNLLYSGSHAGIRKVCLLAHRGCITLPPEVETVLKVRIDKRVGSVWNRWASFHTTTETMDRCYPAGEILVEDGTYTPLQYELPEGGTIIGVMGTCDEEEAYISIQGKDATGRDIYSDYKGEQVLGEKFKIEKGRIRYGHIPFGEVTAVVKPKTNGYVTIFAIDHAHKTQQFLADYSPAEEKPYYKRFRVISRECSTGTTQLSMLCRVKLKDNYLDNELTFFENSLAIEMEAQRIQSEANNDAATAAYKAKAVDDLLEREAGYKKVSGSPMDVFRPLSGGAIRNIVG